MMLLDEKGEDVKGNRYTEETSVGSWSVLQ